MRLTQIDDLHEESINDWIELDTAARQRIKYKDAEVYYRLVKRAKKSRTESVSLRIGMAICNQLDFEVSDRLSIYYSKNNSMIFKLFKTSKGIKLQNSGSLSNLMFTFANRMLPERFREEGLDPFIPVKKYNLDLRNKALIVHL